MKIKYFILGFIASLVLTISGYSFAEDIFNVVRVEYPILVDGKEMASDLPTLNYNGSTYIPLRKFSEATGATVDWDDSAKVINISSALSGKYGKINIEFYSDGSFNVIDKDANGTGYDYLLSRNFMSSNKYEKGHLISESFMFPTQNTDLLPNVFAPTILSKTHDNSNSIFTVKGVVKNNYYSESCNYKVKVVVYDSNRNIIDYKEIKDTMSPNDIKPFIISLTNENFAKAVSYDAIITEIY